MKKKFPFAIHDAIPTNLTSDVLGSIQARGPRERQRKIKLVYTLAMELGFFKKGGGLRWPMWEGKW